MTLPVGALVLPTIDGYGTKGIVVRCTPDAVYVVWDTDDAVTCCDRSDVKLDRRRSIRLCAALGKLCT